MSFLLLDIPRFNEFWNQYSQKYPYCSEIMARILLSASLQSRNYAGESIESLRQSLYDDYYRYIVSGALKNAPSNSD